MEKADIDNKRNKLFQSAAVTTLRELGKSYFILVVICDERYSEKYFIKKKMATIIEASKKKNAK